MGDLGLDHDKIQPTPAIASGHIKRIAVIGGGPAGIAATKCVALTLPSTPH